MYKKVWMIVAVCFSALLLLAGVNAKEAVFTEEERAYIEENPVISVGVDPQFSPYEFIDTDGRYKGIAADYLKLIEIQTGLIFEVQPDLIWPQAYDLARNGEIDLLPCVGITLERQQYFQFTDPYLNYQRVIISREDTPSYTVKDLDTVIVGVQRNSSHSSYLSQLTDNEPVLYNSNDRLLKALTTGEIDCAVTNDASSRYRIRELGLTNLRVDYVFSDAVRSFGMAMAHDDDMMLQILNKALSQITEEETIQIRNKWLGVDATQDNSEVIRMIAMGMSIAVVVFGIIAYWNYTLQREIRRREKLEKDLIDAREEAQEANEAKSRFLANMSHEIRTPLNAITGQTYLLENTRTSVVQSKYVKGIKRASYSLLTTINEILDFSKIEAGEMDVEQITFSLDALLDKVGNMLAPKADEKNLAFHIRRDTDIPDSLTGDPNRIEQILINLINNAVKFTEEGEVNVEVTRNESIEDYCYLSFSVSDTGIGISKEKLDHLFVPFHQLDSSVSRRYGGTGLGLSICKKIAALLEGKIHVTSELGIGSTFVLEVPFECDSTSAAGSGTRHPDFRGIKALVVDEDIKSRTIIGDYLKSSQLEVTEASSVREAFSYLNAHSFYNLVIMELHMPGEDVYELLKSLQLTETNVMLTARHIQESEYATAESYGVRHIIMKPIIASILFDSVIQVFGHEAAAAGVEHIENTVLAKGHHLLLVEDNDVNQMIEREILEQRGYTVTVASDGQEAVTLMSKDDVKVELILMDIHMPVMDGYEATVRIREGGFEGPILAMTAVTFNDIRDKTREAGMDGYVMKPVDPDALFDEIERHIHFSQRAAREAQRDGMKLEDKLDDLIHHDYLNVKQGMGRIGNNKTLYREVLARFYEDIKGVGQNVASLVKNQQYEDASKCVHRIKGSSGNVGAARLFQTSKLLMKAISDGIEVDLGPYVWEFEKDIEETERIIAGILSEASTEDEKTLESSTIMQFTDEVEHRIIELKGLLVTSDLDAFTVCKEIRAMLPYSNATWDSIEASMEKYDFKSAIEAIEAYGL